MINDNYHCEYLFKFLQKNKYDLKTSSTASENYYNDIHYNSFLFRDDMIIISTTSIIMQRLTATFREKMTFQRLIE